MWYRKTQFETQINAKLAELFGTYQGDWTERSIRLAGNVITDSPKLEQEIGEGLGRAHPSFNLFDGDQRWRGRDQRTGEDKDVFGHWILRDGSLTGQVRDHAESAKQVLDAIPGYRMRTDPITDLMSLGGVIRVRYVSGRMMILDIIHKPSVDQLMKILDLGKQIENKGGIVSWNILNQNDTGTVLDGFGVEDLANVDWRRFKTF